MGDLTTRLSIFTVMLDLGRGKCSLQLIGASDRAEVYEIQSELSVYPPLVVKCPPFRKLDGQSADPRDEADAFDKGCVAILREMQALSRIGSCAFVNMAQYAVSVLGVPALIFHKLDTDLRTLVTSDFCAGDRFVRLAVLHMIARGLARAQTKSVIMHQDLKPENILIDFAAEKYVLDGDFPALVIPKINDFELTNKVYGGRLRGFRPYLPAEHFLSGDVAAQVSDRYDIYSLAVIAHELLTCGFHPMPGSDPRGLHCSAYVDGFQQPYRNEERWKKWARAPAADKTLPAISDRPLADALRAALDPNFRARPTASEMAAAFMAAMEREDAAATRLTKAAIEFLEWSGENGSGAEHRFPAQAQEVISQFPELVSAYFG